MRVSFIFHDGTKVFKVLEKQDIPLLEHSVNFEEGKNNSFFVKQPTSLEALKIYFNKDKEISIYIDLETKIEFLRLASFLAEEFNDEGLPVRFSYGPARFVTEYTSDWEPNFIEKEYSAADFLYGGSFLSEECYMDNWMNSIFKMFHLLPEPSQISIATSYWHFCFIEGNFSEFDRWTCFRDHWNDMANYLWESQDRNLFCGCVGTKKFGKLRKCETLDEFVKYLEFKQPKKREIFQDERKYREISKRSGFSTIVDGNAYRINFRKR
jgi:hypothetical protein